MAGWGTESAFLKLAWKGPCGHYLRCLRTPTDEGFTRKVDGGDKGTLLLFVTAPNCHGCLGQLNAPPTKKRSWTGSIDVGTFLLIYGSLDPGI
jgi:hypothetical protein